MSKLLYSLEDYFDAVSRERRGWLSGRLSRALGSVFAVSGDFLVFSAMHRRAD